MGLLAKLSGKEQKGGNAFVFVFGSDKRFVRRNMELQGSHVQDNVHRLAHFSSSDAIGTFMRRTNGVTRTLGPVSLAHELATELYSFRSLKWLPDRLKDNDEGDGHHELFERDEVLDNGIAEGFAIAHQKQGDDEARNRLIHILLLTMLGAFFMFLAVGASTGLISNLFSGIGKVFG